MKQLLFVLYFAAITLSKSASCLANSATNSTIDTSRYVVFPFYPLSRLYSFNGMVTPGSLSEREITSIEKLITKTIAGYNQKEQQRIDREIEKYKKEFKSSPPVHFNYDGRINALERYHRQLIPVTNIYGEKEVWVNCVCWYGFDRWRRDIAWAQGGGTCYFQMKVNLTQNTVSDFKINEPL